jgi:hypothetical protein
LDNTLAAKVFGFTQKVLLGDRLKCLFSPLGEMLRRIGATSN